MAYRKTGFRAKQSRHMSRRMDESMVGSHVQRGAHNRTRANASSVSFSSSRASGRASSSHLDTLAPSSTSGESDAVYRQRSRQRGYVEGIQRRSNVRRVVTVVIAVLVVVGIAFAAGFIALRGSVGSEMSLKHSDAADALVAVRSDEPSYTLVAAELGAVAEPLEQAGPDLVLLAYVDRAANKLALVNIPSSLQVSVDGAQRRLGDLAETSDAAFIRAVQNFAKVDISHYIKVGKGGIASIVDALGGVEVTLDQVIDDPHAGDTYLPIGTYTLNGSGVLTYLRADNIALGVEDRLKNQANFAALLVERIFGGGGAFVTRLESMASSIQTDLSLSDLEGFAGWFANKKASDITRTPLPGYMTSTAGVVDLGESLFVGTSADMAAIIAALEGGEEPVVNESENVTLVSPSSFTVEVQNGTEIAGAAGATADTLTAKGFRVEKSGNAEQQVYTETLVVYKANDGQGAKKEEDIVYDEDSYVYDEDGELIEEELVAEPTAAAAGGNENGVGLSRAMTVIDALGLGRAVEAGAYYSFDTDVLVIIGSDYKPVS